MRWARTTKSDPAVCALADRHYPPRKRGSKQVGGPARQLVFRTIAGDAAWRTTWPLYPKHAYGDAWICSLFRSESGHLASELILEALAATAFGFSPPPPAGVLTFIDPTEVASPNPGYCFKVVGFVFVGRTAGAAKGRRDLDVLHLAPELVPTATPPPVSPACVRGRMTELAARPLQTALATGDEHPVGPIPESVVLGDNAALIASIAPLYLTGSVLDVTHGRGMWWRRFTPSPFGRHDLATDGVDFRRLPHADRSWDTVCFDPPYVPRQGPAPATKLEDATYRARYGLDVPRGPRELELLIFAGLAESARVARRYVLVKCCDYVNCRRLKLGHLAVIAEGERLGLRVHDLIIHAAGTGPGGRQILTVQRARRAHSYLIVFAIPKARKGAA